MKTRSQPCNDSCPNPQFATQIDCIKTKKVFQSCQNFFTQEHCIEIPCELNNGITGVKCEKAVLVTDRDLCEPVSGLKCCIDCFEHTVITGDSFDVIIYLRVLPSGILIKKLVRIKIPDDKRVFFLSRAGEPGLKCMAEVFVDCQNCRLEHSKCDKKHIAKCCLGIMIIGKLFSIVEIMIPTVGYCPLPEECITPPEFCPPRKEEHHHHEECHPCEEEHHHHEECHPCEEEHNKEERDYLDEWLKMDLKFDQRKHKKEHNHFDDNDLPDFLRDEFLHTCEGPEKRGDAQNDNNTCPKEKITSPRPLRGDRDEVEVICDKVFIGHSPISQFKILEYFDEGKKIKDNYYPNKVKYPWDKD